MRASHRALADKPSEGREEDDGGNDWRLRNPPPSASLDAFPKLGWVGEVLRSPIVRLRELLKRERFDLNGRNLWGNSGKLVGGV